MEKKKAAAETKYRNYKSAVLPAGEPLHQKGKHAVVEIQCPPSIPFDQDLLPCYYCAKGWCTEFPTYRPIPTEKNTTIDDPSIAFQQYETQYKCNEHDALKKGLQVCPKYEQRRMRNTKVKEEQKDTKLGKLHPS